MTCKDCISEKVCRYNDGINLYCKENYECPHFKNKYDYAKVKHGEWRDITKFNTIGDIPYYRCECSECGFSRNFFADDEACERPNYCEVCGAKMEGVKNDE